jgi:hypothetical protein
MSNAQQSAICPTTSAMRTRRIDVDGPAFSR